MHRSYCVLPSQLPKRRMSKRESCGEVVENGIGQHLSTNLSGLRITPRDHLNTEGSIPRVSSQ